MNENDGNEHQHDDQQQEQEEQERNTIMKTPSVVDNNTNTIDNDEINLDEVEEEEETETTKLDSLLQDNNDKSNIDADEINLDEVEEEVPTPETVQDNSNKSKNSKNNTQLSSTDALKLRLRLLKQKMSQARQLNTVAVKEEGERLRNGNGTSDGISNNKKKKNQQPLVIIKETTTSATTNPLQQLVSTMSGIDCKLLIQPAAIAIDKYNKQCEKNELNQYNINDYYNPEGQYRNYIRNIKSIPTSTSNSNSNDNISTTTDTIIYDSFTNTNSNNNEIQRQGVKRLATEMKKRISKRLKQQDKKLISEINNDTNVSHINQRNKRFNEKINRTYDKHTSELKQNLERGSAL